MADFDGRVAFVTGGSGGIGRAVARQLAAEGARVAVADHAAVEETVAQIRDAGGTALALRVDVRDEASVERGVAETIASFGGLHCAFNNAGIGTARRNTTVRRATGDVELADFETVIATNLTGVFLCMKHELRHMAASGGGAIVNTASIAGLLGLRGAAAYTASKHGVIGLTRSAALEYAEHAVRVNAVCPGYVRTAMTAEIVEHRSAEILAKVPFDRFGEPQEIAELVVWLLSDRASFVSGSAYAADGGYSAA